MQVGVLGINHKCAELQLRELLAKVCQQRFKAGYSTHGEHVLVLLSTCNRTEIYFSSHNLVKTHNYLLSILRQEIAQQDNGFDQKLYSYFGHHCFLHLARVTTGLDSALVGETEIQGQVKASYHTTTNYTSLPQDMHFIFQKALKIGKQVRTTVPLGHGAPNLRHTLLGLGYQMFSNPKNASILLIGASDINRTILSFFKMKEMKNLTLCNRSEEYAQKLAKQYQIHFLKWEELSSWHNYDWVICSTKAPQHLITRKKGLFPRCRQLVVDLSVPRNIDPALGQEPHITLFNIDQINQTLKVRKKNMSHTLSHAEAVVTQSVRKSYEIFREKEQKRQQRLLALGA